VFPYCDVTHIVILDISKTEIITAIQKALSVNFINNLRDRDPSVAFDSKVRGYIGETALIKWLNSNGVVSKSVSKTDASYLADIDLNIRGMKKDYLTEIKTSAKPEAWRDNVMGTNDVLLSNCIKSGDIKVFTKSGNANVDIDRDIYIQIYFGIKTAEHDNEIVTMYKANKDVLFSDYETIYRLFNFAQYIENIYFVGWIDKNSILNNLSKLPVDKQTYLLGKYRKAYYCNLNKSYIPSALIDYLKS